MATWIAWCPELGHPPKNAHGELGVPPTQIGVPLAEEGRCALRGQNQGRPLVGLGSQQAASWVRPVWPLEAPYPGGPVLGVQRAAVSSVSRGGRDGALQSRRL